jgi:sugar phosphate isomerase/epimerase
MEYLDQWKHRLKVLHLNDNDGTLDRHQPPFYGTVNWEKLTGIIADSGLTNLPLSFELSMKHTPFYNPAAEKNQTETDIVKFLADAFERCSAVEKLYKESLASKAETANSVRSTR